MKWEELLTKIEKNTGMRPEGLHAVLFLVGVQEVGEGPRRYTKSEKELLMHIALCRVVSTDGFYERDGVDKRGWPRWKNVKKMQKIALEEQELFIKQKIIEYFKEELAW